MKKLLCKILLRLKLIFISIFDVHSNLYWSQEGEDILLQRIFDNKKNGFYVDVGAHHSNKFSNTFKLYAEKNWNGINIDSSIHSYKNLNRKRKRDININLGVSDKNEILNYYSFTPSELNTFDKDKKNKLKKILILEV